MAVVIVATTSGAQGLANRLGKLAALLTHLDTVRLTTLPGLVEDAVELFDGAVPDVRALVAALNPDGLATLRSGNNPALIRSLAQAYVVKMVDDDNPLPKASLEYALPELLKQLSGAYNVPTNVVTASVTKTSLSGNGNVVASVLDGRGKTIQTMLAEDLVITVENNATAGSEVLRVRGEAAVADKLSYLWPAGSGANRTYTSLISTATGNLITNGSFDTFTVANTPDSFTITTGAAGTDVFSENSTVYRSGGKSLKITGDGATLVKLTSANLVSLLAAQTPYALNLWARNSTNPAAGVLTLDLFDGSSVINDEAGTANSFTVDLTTLGTSFTAKSGVFRLPDPLPAAVYLRLHTSTAITNTHSLYLDDLAMQEMEQPKSGVAGTTPFVSFFSGSSPWSIDDGAPDGATVFKIATTNDWESLWTKFLERVLDLSDDGHYLPTSGGSTLDEALLS